MKTTLLAGAAIFLASMLTGCVIAPVEPVAYKPPHQHHYHPYWRARGWRR